MDAHVKVTAATDPTEIDLGKVITQLHDDGATYASVDGANAGAVVLEFVLEGTNSHEEAALEGRSLAVAALEAAGLRGAGKISYTVRVDE